MEALDRGDVDYWVRRTTPGLPVRSQARADAGPLSSGRGAGLKGLEDGLPSDASGASLARLHGPWMPLSWLVA